MTSSIFNLPNLMQRKLNDEFIREYSEEFSEKITSEFFTGQERITGKEILNVSPSKQVNFFILKILFRKWQEEMKKLESPYFNYKNPDVRKAMVQFMNTLSQHIEITGDHFISMAEEAVADTILLAVDPGSYLSMEFEEMDVSKVTEKMTRPILKYIKLHKGEIAEFFAENEGADIDEFVENTEEFFSSLDVNETVQNQLELLSEVIPLSEDDLYFKEEDELEFDNDEEGLPAIDESILEEDELDEEDAAAVNFEYPEEEDAIKENEHFDEVKEELNESETEDVETTSGESAEDNQQVEEESVEEPLTIEASESYDEETFDEEGNIGDESPDVEEDRSEDQMEGQETPPDDTEEDKAPIVDTADDLGAVESNDDDAEEDQQEQAVNERFSEKQPTVNERYSADEEKTVAKSLENKQVNTIMEAISVNHRYMFTKELFDGDRDAFTSAIDQMDKQESFDDAVEILVQSYANKLGWDMNSDEVKELLKVIFRRFR